MTIHFLLHPPTTDRLRAGAPSPGSRRPDLTCSSPPPLVGQAPTRTGASGPRLQRPRLLTTAALATAPPAAGTPPATGSTTAAGRGSGGSSAPPDRAPGSVPRRTSRTPSAAATASPHGAAPPTGGAPAPAAPTTPSG